ncbi:hypothetical protein ACFL28_05540, partial [Candidatus Omnitrophota bacterium]
ENIEQHIEDGVGLVVMQFAPADSPYDFNKITIFDNGRGFYDDTNDRPVTVKEAVQPGVKFGAGKKHGDALDTMLIQTAATLILNNNEAVLCRKLTRGGVIETKDIENMPDFNRGVWITGYFPSSDFSPRFLLKAFDIIANDIEAEFEGWNRRIPPSLSERLTTQDATNTSL